MKKLIMFLFILIKSISFSEINIKIFEPIRFKEISTIGLGSDRVIGVGILEISTDDLEIDKDKKLKFNFPKKGLMTNRKKWIKIDEYRLETLNNDFIITKKIEQIKIFAILNKRDIDNGEEADVIEGDYIGYVPIIISQYSKLSS
ncbi:hypothetical protein [Cetobacterium sp.]|uniref:hypothetical protein n=2 Tax=Cetobacterium sp. TaxID=2071632 RepID=UPI0025BEA4BF|nr:hypothetical protein [Cetobacterium sp.]